MTGHAPPTAGFVIARARDGGLVLAGAEVDDRLAADEVAPEGQLIGSGADERHRAFGAEYARWRMTSCAATTLVTPTRVLLVPPTWPHSRRMIAARRFLAGLPSDVGELLQSSLDGEVEVLTVVPATEIARLLETPPNVDEAAAVASVEGGTWVHDDLMTIAGPLSPAVPLGSRKYAGHVLCFKKVLPSPGAFTAPGMTATGIRHDADEASLVAAAEAYERHVAGWSVKSELVEASFDELDSAVPPEHVIAFRPWQHRVHRDLLPFDPTQRRVWVLSRRENGTPAPLLADLVFYPFGRANTARHAPANSSGMAAHTTRADAVAAGWAELVERDAFMRHWLARQPARRVAMRDTPAVARQRADLHDLGWRLDVLQLGDDPQQPIFCAAARRNGMLALGAAAGPTTTAIEGAVREAWAGVRVPRHREEVPEIHDVRSPSDHRRLYRWGNNANVVEFLWSGDETVRSNELTDLAPPTARTVIYDWPGDLTAPFRVVRVVCPDMVPITFGYEREPLGRPDALALLVGAERGNMPHPFP